MDKKMMWTGRVLSWLSGVFILTSGINILFVQSPDLVEQFGKFGYPASVIPLIGWAALLSSVLYLIPKTQVLGAILLTGYLGGAVATHVRIEDPAGFAAVVTGVFVWLGLWLRDGRLRSLTPLQQ
ncbi:MAG: DoxX family protein [Acidobacteriota bacterium]